MTKLQSRTVNVFLIGLLMLVIGFVLILFKVELIFIKLLMTPGTIMVCLSSIVMSINPLKHEE